MMKMELRSFLELNESMALRAVLDALQAVETAWDESVLREKALERLLEILDWAQAHRFESVRQLSSLSQRVPSEPTYHQFMSFVAPIERAYGRGVTDADFAVRSVDLVRPRSETLPLVLVVDNLRSAFNVGSIFRTAECFGVDEIYLCGYTSRPDQEKLKKAAMGTEELVRWRWHARVEECVSELKADNYRVYALETADAAVSLDRMRFEKGKTALVFGNERFGVEASILRLCDGVIEIPCQGQKNSLNVALSVGVAVYEWRKQYLGC
ncbi:MAG: TrmH family RNA methyltransferase [Proteobacteria bacterium]|nr:MAG: TrmH family RNA methyltransferase [Pseudomonadota bacterium]